MSSQSLTLKVTGLYTFPSDLSEVPPGALSQADNVVISRDGIVAPRRGYDYLKHNTSTKSTFSDASYRANKLFFYQSQHLAHYSTNLLAYHDSTAGWTQFSGTYAPVTGTKVRSAEANQNFYFTTSAGVYKLDAYNGTPVQSGAYKALDCQASISASASTWLLTATRTAYRVVWGYKDANNNLILGAPSQREAITNTSGSTKAIDLVITIPAGITTAWFYQVYRAAAVASTIEPNEEMGLVYEANPTAGELVAKTLTITDITPDELRGATLYTSPSQQGLAAGNEQPPLAHDIATFRGSMFYGNTVSKHRYFLTLLSAASPNGIQANDTLTIGGVVYTAKASETIASGEFAVASGGATAGQNIRDTALSLVRVINRYASSTVYAYYLSGPDDLPGKLLIEARSAGGSSFPVISSRATCWNPSLPTSGTTQSSTNDAFKHALFYSKADQPEAVPLGNFLYAGSADKSILRVIALQESLFVFKEDGTYRISGDGADSFRVALLDNTAIMIAPETAQVLNNQIFMLSTQGVVSVSEGGVTVRSRPIESDLLDLQAVDLTTLASESFGVSYESERSYYLWVISAEGDTYPTQYYQFNTFTNSWVRGTLAKKCGGVNPADARLYLGNAMSNIVDVERKDLQFSDYADYGSTQTISAVVGTLVSLSGSDTVSIGDVLYQSSSVFGLVIAVDSVAGTATTSLPVDFAVGSVDVLKAIATVAAWTPTTQANPGITKHFRECSLLFLSDFNGDASVSFSSDVSPSPESEAIAGSSVGGWGLFAWGGPAETALGVPWGGDNRRRPIRVMVPRNHQRCTLLTITFSHAVGYAPWLLQGISIIGNGLSERVAS